FMLIVPTLPVIYAAITNVEASAKLMWIPSLSQHLLVTTVIKAQRLDPLLVALSVASTLAFAVLLAFAATRLYRREAFLGSRAVRAYVNARGPLLRARSRSRVFSAGKVRSKSPETNSNDVATLRRTNQARLHRSADRRPHSARRARFAERTGRARAADR